MTRGRWAALAAVVLIVGVAAWYLGSPAYTLSQMKDAAEANDSDAFASYIDFPALREDMKAEIMAQMMAEAQTEQNEFGGLGMALGTAMIGPMIDNMISPTGVRAMFIRNRNAAAASPDDPVKGLQLTEAVSQDSPVIERRGFSEFLVTSKDAAGAGMVFKRDGLGWKLSGVDMPAKGTGQVASASVGRDPMCDPAKAAEMGLTC